MRIEINLPKEVVESVEKRAKTLNHSRKSYIEFLCMDDAEKRRELQAKENLKYSGQK